MKFDCFCSLTAESFKMIRLLPLLLLASPLLAQTPSDIAMERAGYLAWLKTAPNSPLTAVAQQRIGDGLRLGPADADIPLTGVAEYRVYPSGAGLTLEGPEGKRSIGAGRPYRIQTYALFVTRTQLGTVLTVFGGQSDKQPPGHYPYDPALVFTGPLLRPDSRQIVRVLTADGLETEATEAGSFVVPLGPTTLRVLRVPVGGGDETELEIFFRDGTNGDGSYPAGRFVSLIPAGEGKFRIDFNRARNPFCAYSSVYACPLPWRGNVIPAPVRAGERYAGGGLENPPAAEEAK
jgi:hypothetical protein